MHQLKNILADKNKIVIKIGTNLLAHKEFGINISRINTIAENIAYLQRIGKKVILVSSGAIGAGVFALKLKQKPKSIPEKQATAAIGQPLLMEIYENAFRAHNIIIGQILLTKDDFANRTRYINAKNTFTALLEKNIVPIVNENDTVAVEEIKLGDNDNLSALVANVIEADLCIILSDIDGLFSDDPTKNKNATLIPIVEKITLQIEKLAQSAKTELSTGGMITKIQAAKKCVSSGIPMIIANGTDPNILKNIFSANFTGTIFLPSIKKLNVKKRWIAFASNSKGKIMIDDGAKQALLVKNKSLLPSGIIEIQGDFNVNDTVTVLDINEKVIAKGVTSFSSFDIDKIKGKKTTEIEKILNIKNCEEVIHRDNLVLFGE